MKLLNALPLPGSLYYDLKANSLLEIVESNDERGTCIVLLGFKKDKAVFIKINFKDLFSPQYYLLDPNLYAHFKCKKENYSNSFIHTLSFGKIKAIGMHKFDFYKTAFVDLGEGQFAFAYAQKFGLRSRERI